MNQESQEKAFRALGAVEGYLEQLAALESEGEQYFITGTDKVLADLKILETEFREVSELARRAQALFNG